MADLIRKVDLAYMAGIFDGEGCVSIVYRKPPREDLSPSYSTRLSISITDKVIPHLFRLVFGGNFHIKKRKVDYYRTCWIWSITGAPAVNMCKALLPYLKIKKAEVELAIKFEERRHHGGYGRGIKKPMNERVLQEADFILMKSLKNEVR